MLTDYTTTQLKTATTVVNQQYYHFPTGFVNVETATIDLGSYTQPLEVINSQRNWDILNSIQIQASAVPQFIFPRRDDFGIWPIPQGLYTINLNYHLRDRHLTQPDYTTGTATFTNNSQTVTGSGTTWGSWMTGWWVQNTSSTAVSSGYWYRVASVGSTTSLTLETSYEQTTASTSTYRIGQVPEIPEEGQITLVDGTTADFFSGLMSDVAKGTWFNNKFWTGDGNNNSRKQGDPSVAGGLIGLAKRYGNRNDSRLINRKPHMSPLTYQVWGTRIT